MIVNHGDLTVHRPGCRDIERQCGIGAGFQSGHWWDESGIRDFHDIVLAIYGPNAGSFFAECGDTMLDWEQHGGSINVAPCVGALSYDLPGISDDDRALRWGDDRGERTRYTHNGKYLDEQGSE